MSAQRPIPLVIDYPPGEYGSNLPTGGPPSPTIQDDSTETDIAQIVAQGSLIDSQIQPIPIPTNHNCCFRDAVLTGLFSTRPFVGYLEHWVNFLASATPKSTGDSARDFILKGLQSLAQEFYRPSPDKKKKKDSLDKLASAFHQGWNNFGDQDVTAQEDGPLYLQALLQNLNPQNQDDFVPDDTFAPLFFSEFVGRNAFQCACKTKSREPQHRPDDDRYLIPVSITPERPSLSAAFEYSFYDRQGERTAKCPTCDTEAAEHRYLKFRHLPEVLFLQLEFPKKTKQGSITRDSQIRCTLPEELDLDLLQDKIDKTKGLDESDPTLKQQLQRLLPNVTGAPVNVAKDSRYKLQFVVDYQGVANTRTSTGHYRCNIRRPDDSWELFDGLKRHGRAHTVSLKAIEADKLFQPRLVAYVRQHGRIGDGADNDKNQGQEGTSNSDQSRPPASTLRPSAAKRPPQQTGLSASPEYDSWNGERLRFEILKRRLAMPRKKDAATLRGVLRQHDQNPRDYTLLTAKLLNQMVTQRKLNSKSKKPLVKQEMVDLLIQDDQTASTSGRSKSPSVVPSTVSVDGNTNQKNVGNTLQTQFDNLAKKMQPQKAQLELLMKEFVEMKNQLQSAPTKVHQPANMAQSDSEALQQVQAKLAAANKKVHLLRDKCSDLEEKVQSTSDDSNLLLSVAVKLGVGATENQPGWEISRQYLIAMEGRPPGDQGFPTANLRTAQDPVDATGLLVRVEVNIPGSGIPQQHIINVPIPKDGDANGLRMSSTLDIIKLTGPCLIHQAERSISPLPAQVETQKGSKRSHDEMAGGSASPTNEPPAKRQRLESDGPGAEG